ncbi:MAG: hypothetical protein F4X02_05575 [Chloroflexi bacterium]|nr:hypothetical protein [Chloroflexota bacterium]
MAYEICINASTDLSLDEIYEVLSKGIDIQRDEHYPATIVGDGFYCYVSRFEADAKYSFYLDKPVTLDVTFRYHPAAKGNGDLMAFVSNWLRYTDADSILEHNGEYVSLLRVDGKLIRNINPQVLYYCASLDLGEIPHEEADLGIWLVEDDIFVESPHDTLQIMEIYCQCLFADSETEIVEGLTAVAPKEIRAIVERDAFRIATFRYHPFEWSLKWKRGDDRYPFLANYYIDVFYTKGRGIPLMTHGAYDVSIRDDTLRAVAGLIRTTDYNLLVEFSDPKRDVLMYHSGELTLYEDSCWTEDRLRLFEGIPYTFCAPIP